ncbi:hypothetical protein TYRP_019853 [Tyrophagus putrescentiae]|nr:hypothetical protein TYRP_019853 [Tyrophagus putrescentiae]
MGFVQQRVQTGNVPLVFVVEVGLKGESGVLFALTVKVKHSQLPIDAVPEFNFVVFCLWLCVLHLASERKWLANIGPGDIGAQVEYKFLKGFEQAEKKRRLHFSTSEHFTTGNLSATAAILTETLFEHSNEDGGLNYSEHFLAAILFEVDE